MTRRSRVPGTTSDTWRLDVACGGDPARAVLRALYELLEQQSSRGDIWKLGVGHDDGCPAMEGAGMSSCSCEIVQLRAKRAA